MEWEWARCSRTPIAGRWRQSRGNRRRHKCRGPCPVHAVRFPPDKFQKLVSISTGITTLAKFVIGGLRRSQIFPGYAIVTTLPLRRMRLAKAVRVRQPEGEK